MKRVVVPTFTRRVFQFSMDPFKGEHAFSWSLWPAILHDIHAWLHWLQQGWTSRLGQHLCPSVPESYTGCESGNCLGMNCDTGTESVIRQRDSRKCQVQFPDAYVNVLSIKGCGAGKESWGTNSRKCSLGDPGETVFKVEARMCGRESSLACLKCLSSGGQSTWNLNGWVNTDSLLQPTMPCLS